MAIQLLFFAVVIGGMYYFMYRTQKKDQKKKSDMLNQMKPGAKVVTIGGLHGVVFEASEGSATVTLDCEGVYLEFERSAIARVEASTETVSEETVVEEVTEESKLDEPNESETKE